MWSKVYLHNWKLPSVAESCIKLPQMSHKVNFNSPTRWPLPRPTQFNVLHYSSKQDGDSILAYRSRQLSARCHRYGGLWPNRQNAVADSLL